MARNGFEANQTTEGDLAGRSQTPIQPEIRHETKPWPATRNGIEANQATEGDLTGRGQTPIQPGIRSKTIPLTHTQHRICDGKTQFDAVERVGRRSKNRFLDFRGVKHTHSTADSTVSTTRNLPTEDPDLAPESDLSPPKDQPQQRRNST